MIHLPVAYLGPGAGFAFLGSFFTLVLSLLASLVSFLLWPLRMLRGALRRGRGMRGARVRRVILLGLDGLDADRVDALSAAGKLPNLARLNEARISAAAWSVFATGASTGAREPFWKVLGQHAVGSTILLVPGTNPERFDGRILTAASPAAGRESARFTFARGQDCFDGELTPEVPFRVSDIRSQPRLEIGGGTYPPDTHVFTPWIRVRPGGDRGMVRFLLTTSGEDLSLYASARETDPGHPETPISHPRGYSAYLAKLLGDFATQPEVADEGALYAGAIESEDFLMQIKLAQEEREGLFFSALERQPRGVVACVFDTPLRLERVFGAYDEVVEWSYREMDRLAGRVLAQVDDDAILLIVSNHSRGALLSNRKLRVESAGMEDIAPTVLQLFGINPPEWMRGRPVVDVA